GGDEFGFDARVPIDGLRRHLLIRRSHLTFGLPQTFDEDVEVAHRENALHAGGGEVAAARVLRQVADGAGDRHGSRLSGVSAHDHLGQGRLAGAIAPDETDTVALIDAEGHLGHEGAGADGDFEAGGLNHSVSKLRPMSSARNSWGWM